MECPLDFGRTRDPRMHVVARGLLSREARATRDRWHEIGLCDPGRSRAVARALIWYGHFERAESVAGAILDVASLTARPRRHTERSGRAVLLASNAAGPPSHVRKLGPRAVTSARFPACASAVKSVRISCLRSPARVE